MESIILIILLLFVFCPFINAAVALALDRGMSEGMLFSFWLKFWRWAIGENSFFYKPLGGCIHCMAIWLSIPVYITLNIFFRHLFELGLMPYDFYILEYWHILIWIAYASISDLLISKFY